MSKKILIINDVPFHYEIIPSVIVKYGEIIKDLLAQNAQIFLYIVDDYPERNNSYGFREYVKKQFPHVEFTENNNYKDFDYVISCTAVAENSPKEHGPTRPSNMKKDKHIFYIAHDIDAELIGFENVFFLSSLNRLDVPKERVFLVDTLPLFTKPSLVKKIKPTVLVQGSFVRAALDNTRNYSILEKILSYGYSHDFSVKVIGSWHLPEKFNIWDFIDINKVKKQNIEKVSVELNLDWDEYNSSVLSSDVIMPLISIENQPEYFYRKATSTIGYIQSYNLNVFCDKNFAKTYGIPKDKTFLYDGSSIKKSFEYMLSCYNEGKAK
jgi:hypothetical protein